MTLLVFFLLLIFLYSLVSGRLERTVITAPIVFAAAGMLAHFFLPTTGEPGGAHGLFLTLAEIGLVLLLFTDASRTGLRDLESLRALPVRLLSIGMLLTIALGAVAAFLIFPDLTLLEAGILAAILAPTDAGLGQIIVNSPRVPLKIRQALNVEAGLNDGLSVPFLLFFIALAISTVGGDETSLIAFIVEQLGYGLLVGGGIGLAGGWLMEKAHRRKWMTPGWIQLGTVMLPALCLLVSGKVAASPFIAAFVAGLAVQVRFRDAAHHSVEFAESSGQFFNLSVFFLFGLMVPRAWSDFTFAHALYAVLSLTVVRMLPVAISLIRSRLSPASVLFLGWFGPRGLASIVLGLVFIEQDSHLVGESTIRLAVMLTVLVSILVHGLTAQPGISIYTGKLAALPADAPEFEGAGVEVPPAAQAEGRS